MPILRLILTMTRTEFFFFQAEDGIRVHCVTGVQTCVFRSHLSNFSEYSRTAATPRCASIQRSSTSEIGRHTSEHQSHSELVCRLLLEKKKKINLVKKNSKNIKHTKHHKTSYNI